MSSRASPPGPQDLDSGKNHWDRGKIPADNERCDAFASKRARSDRRIEKGRARRSTLAGRAKLRATDSPQTRAGIFARC